MRKHLRLVRPPRYDSSTGLDTRLASVLCYAFLWLSGLIFYLVERRDQVVRFHAAQSLLTFGILSIVWYALGLFARLPVLGILFIPLQMLLFAGGMLLWIFLMVKAASGAVYRLPWVGDAAARNVF